MTHRDLTLLSDKEILSELINSKSELEQRGFKVYSFASPGGAYNQRTLSAIKQIYQAHRTLDAGINYRPIEPYQIKSFDVNRDGLEDLNKAFKLILETKETKGHLVLTFHKIDEQGANLSYPIWKLEALCQYARAQGFQPFSFTQGGYKR